MPLADDIGGLAVGGEVVDTGSLESLLSRVIIGGGITIVGLWPALVDGIVFEVPAPLD